MLHKNLGVIDPAKMGEQESKSLAMWLESHAQMSLVNKECAYTFQSSPASYSYSFKLSHQLLRRQRKPGKNGIRYEVLSKELGRGNNGVVYLSIGTISIQNGLAVFKKKDRATKEFYSDTDAAIEYEFTSKIPRIHVKPLTTAPSLFAPRVKLSSYMVEKYFEGSNLFAIIEAELSGNLLLSIDERIQLSLDILLAVQEVHDLQLIHRDIKPENIMVSKTTKSVTLIDFRYSKYMNDPNPSPESAGTLVTMPPEQFSAYPKEKQIYTDKSDCYAVGKSLAELWNAVAEINAESSVNYFKFYKFSLKDTIYDYSKSYLSGLSDQHAARIKDMLEQLTRSEPEDRWTIAQAVELLKQIQQDRSPQPAENNKMLPSKHL